MPLFGSKGVSGVIADVLGQVCGQYIENVDPRDLNLSIMKGVVELKDLKLKKEALDELGLPIEVQRGMVDKLVVNVPWMHLSSRPLVINIDTVFLTASDLRFPADFDSEAYEKVMMQFKETAMAAFELQHQVHD